MPRDLSSYSAQANDSTLREMPALSKLGKEIDGKGEQPQDGNHQYEDEYSYGDDNDNHNRNNEKRDELHPYTQTLSVSDVESCVRLEEAAFPPHERCTREKFQYRLQHCGELSLGVFTSEENSQAATAATSSAVCTGTPERKAILMGHIVATKTTNPTVTDDDMAIPTPENHASPHLGHKGEGRTVCIHSLAVLPDYQNRGLGTTLLKAYLQRIENQRVADRAALIAHQHLIPYYERFGFENMGSSAAQFGGGGWYDMVKTFAFDDSE